MSLFGRLAQTVFDVATAPIDVAKDVVTLFGLATGHPGSYTADKAKQIGQDLDEVRQSLGDL